MTAPAPLPAGMRRSLLTVCAMAATIMQALDSTIANVALPYMQGRLSASMDQINWVLTSYIVTAAIMTAPIGWVAERFGRKRLFIVCVGGFTFASVLCGSAQTIEEMVLFRALQGSFGAALVPLSQAVLLDAYTLAERGSAMAIWGIGVMLVPFVRFVVFRDRNFVTGFVFMAIIGVAVFGTMALVTPFMQNIIGYPVTTAGWLLGTRGIGTLLSMMVISRLLRFIEARWLLLVGLVLMAGTLYQMELFTEQTSGTTIAVTSVIQGFGIGMLFVPLSTVAFLTLGNQLRTDGTAMLTLIRNIFSSIGISVMIAELTSTTTVMHARLVENVTPFNDALRMPNVASTLDMATDPGKALLHLTATQQAITIPYAIRSKTSPI